jgi:hypothetical protein
MKLAVFGSRSITDNRVKIEIADFLNGHPDFDVLVTTQEPKGVCALAQVYAKENAIPLELHFLNIKRYARGAFEHRSDEVIKSAEFIYVKLDKSTELEREENSDILRENKPKEKPKKYDFFDL